MWIKSDCDELNRHYKDVNKYDIVFVDSYCRDFDRSLYHQPSFKVKPYHVDRADYGRCNTDGSGRANGFFKERVNDINQVILELVKLKFS